MVWLALSLACVEKVDEDLDTEVVDADTAADTDTDSGDTDSGDTDSGDTDSGGTDSGGTDSGDTDSGGTDSGETSDTADTASTLGFLGSVEVDAVATWSTHGGTREGRIGSIDNLALAEDLDGDGTSDLVIGSPFEAPGSVFVLPEPSRWGGDVETDAVAIVEGASELGFVPLSCGDVTGDGAADLVVGDRSVDGLGAAYVFAGPLSGTAAVGDAWMTVEGAWATAEWGEASDAADLDGDGVVELVAGAAETGAGVFGVASAAAGVWSAGDLSLTWGGTSGDQLGATVVLGDLNLDGYADALVGAPGRDDAATDAGAVVGYPGAATGLGAASWTFLGPPTSAARAGTNSRGVIRPVDLDDSGLPDVAVSAYAAGTVAVHVDPAPGTYAWTDAATRLGETGSSCGSALSTGDLDADGDADLLVGCYSDPDRAAQGGSLWLFTDLPSGDLGRADASGEVWTAAADQYLGTAAATRDGVLYVVASWRSERIYRGGTLWASAGW